MVEETEAKTLPDGMNSWGRFEALNTQLSEEVCDLVLSQEQLYSVREVGERPAPRFPYADLESLFYYFDQGLQRLEWPSNMGKQLERVAFFAQKMKPCVDCGGDRKAWTGGTGFVTGSKDLKLKKMLADLGLADFDFPADMDCPTCCPKNVQDKDERHAPGWVKGGRHSKGEITARPTGSSKSGSGVPDTGGTESLALLGRLSRLLNIVESIDPISRAAIGEFCHPGGRSVACLWHLTPAGKTILKKHNTAHLSQRQFFENERERQKQDPQDGRGKQHKAADSQSEKLWARTTNVWNMSILVASGKLALSAAREMVS